MIKIKTTKTTVLQVTVLLLSACKKSADDTARAAGNCKTVSIKEDSNPASTYNYDAKGRIFKVIHLNGYGSGTFSYQSASITLTDSGSGAKQILVTDASGRIVSDQYDTYKYTNNGYLIEKTENSRTGTITFNYQCQ